MTMDTGGVIRRGLERLEQAKIDAEAAQDMIDFLKEAGLDTAQAETRLREARRRIQQFEAAARRRGIERGG